jgi:hypothetical protein
MEGEGLLLCEQDPATSLYPKPGESGTFLPLLIAQNILKSTQN